ncbi:hypothetical protein BR93DRAFT_160012 [Coniochaeta sp. PMI_546]|nr:hypothetical protein BR93DRAFT_160012 [Coniochaeta sp. PMI_546]
MAGLSPPVFLSSYKKAGGVVGSAILVQPSKLEIELLPLLPGLGRDGSWAAPGLTVATLSETARVSTQPYTGTKLRDGPEPGLRGQPSQYLARSQSRLFKISKFLSDWRFNIISLIQPPSRNLASACCGTGSSLPSCITKRGSTHSLSTVWRRPGKSRIGSEGFARFLILIVGYVRTLHSISQSRCLFQRHSCLCTGL